MSARSESWFDRLAAPHTRRKSLRVAAAGAAAAVGAAIPLASKPEEAEAAPNPNDCRQGCVFVANQSYANLRRAQNASYWAVQGPLYVGLAGMALGPVLSLLLSRDSRTQADLALKDHKAEIQSCFQPFCPGFNPKAAGGPCDGCEAPYFCNPCALIESGYICCIYEQGDCHGDCCNPSPSGC